MNLQFEEATALWREDSAVWAIIAGEVLLQHSNPVADHPLAVVELGADRAEEAAHLLDDADLNGAGHALIGCTVALALAAKGLTAQSTPIEAYASELAEALSWQASEPTMPDLVQLADASRVHSDPAVAGVRPTLWELALQAGGHAVGLSPHIIRRRDRRDLIETGE